MSGKDTFRYTPFPPIHSADQLKEMFYADFGPASTERIYAVYDKRRPRDSDQDHAGLVGVSAKESKNKTIELGCLLFSEYHGTSLATNAVGLALLWSLDPPSLGGMGLRRVEWKCHSQNAASRGLAERLGFELEGISRWERLFPEGELSLSVEALEKRNGKKEEIAGRHTAIYSLVWDEWDEKRPKLVAMMNKKKSLNI